MADIQRDIQRLRQNLYVRRRRRDARTDLSQWTLQTAMLFALVLNYDFSAGAEWLQQKRRRGTPVADGVQPAQLTTMLEDVFLDSDEQELALWTDPESCPLQATVIRTADSFVRGFRLVQWVRQKNFVNGVAVPSRVLAERYNAYAADPSSGLLAAAEVPSMAFSAGRNWAARWRETFGGKHMGLRVEDPVSLDERRCKVRDTGQHWGRYDVARASKKCQKSVPQNGAKFWTLFWGRPTAK